MLIFGSLINWIRWSAYFSTLNLLFASCYGLKYSFKWQFFSRFLPFLNIVLRKNPSLASEKPFSGIGDDENNWHCGSYWYGLRLEFTFSKYHQWELETKKINFLFLKIELVNFKRYFIACFPAYIRFAQCIRRYQGIDWYFLLKILLECFHLIL